jgi:hypothetical protein
MLSNNNSDLKIGDWIKGTLRDGELILGFIDSMDLIEEVYRVSVVKSDNLEVIGKTIPVSSKQIKGISDSTEINKEQIQSLIDLALATGDQDWFIELSSKLKLMKQLT